MAPKTAGDWLNLRSLRSKLCLSPFPKSRALLATWPLRYPRAWIELVNTPQTDAELDAVRTAIRRGNPLGGEQWQQRIAKRLGLESTLRPRGRPSKAENELRPVFDGPR